jgi:hypothetical protein
LDDSVGPVHRADTTACTLAKMTYGNGLAETFAIQMFDSSVELRNAT